MTAERSLFRGQTVERLIFGTEDARAIGRAVDELCRSRLGASVDAELFRRTSVGTTVGVRLDDGRRVVVKAHQPRQQAPYLAAAAEVQRRLASAGFPCPAPLLGPVPLGRGLATLEELVDEGDFRDTREPALRRSLARLLARLVRLTRPLGAPAALGETWSLWEADGLWPETAHSPIFDFAATAAGAERIDDFGRKAKQRVDDRGPPLVVHTDWSGKHFRFDAGGAVTVVYDWDSLGLATEAKAVGIAAATYTSNYELRVDHAPAPEEVAAFVDEYALARAEPLDPDERRTILAAAAYVVAYTARCEHALGLVADFSRALARHGEDYLPR
jgi:Ser/Thr protein kinase RdoA (MazF antagonist)